MATIRTILKKKTSAQVNCPVCLQVSDRGERAWFVTGFNASAETFDETKGNGRFIAGRGVKAFVVERTENGQTTRYSNKAANDILAEMESRANNIIKNYESNDVQWSMEMFRRDFLAKPSKVLFYAYATEKIEEHRANRRYKKSQILTETLRSFELFDSHFSSLKFQDINTAYLKKYIEHEQHKGNSGNSIAVRLCEIRAILNDAIANGVGCLQTYPFGAERDHKISIKAYKESGTQKDNFLPMKYLGLFAKAELTNLRQATAQHLFLLSYFANGANWRDMAYWTADNITTTETIDLITGETQTADIIRYTRGKTKKAIEIQLTEEIKRELKWFRDNTELLDNYLLPIIRKHEDPSATLQHVSDARCRYNLTLREITAQLDFPERFRDIAAYTARHTFAVSMQVMGASAAQIGHNLGHQDGDTKTVQNYTAKTQETTKVFDPTK